MYDQEQLEKSKERKFWITQSCIFLLAVVITGMFSLSCELQRQCIHKGYNMLECEKLGPIGKIF